MSPPAIRTASAAALTAGALMAGIGAGPSAWGVLAAVLAVTATGAGAFGLAAPVPSALTAGALTAVGALLRAGVHPPALTAALLEAAVAAVGALMGAHQPRSADVEASDGILAVGALVVVSLALGVLAPVPRLGPSYHTTLVLLILYLATPPLEAASALAVLSRGRRLGPFLESRYGRRPGLAGMVGRGIMAGVGLLLVASVAVMVEATAFGVRVTPNNPFVYSPHLAARAPWWGIVALLAAVVLMAPLAEELLFRGLLFGGLASVMGLWPAAVVSALIFGAAHLDASLLVGLSIAGLALNALYWQQRSLWVSTAAHATLNAVSVLLALLVR